MPVGPLFLSLFPGQPAVHLQLTQPATSPTPHTLPLPRIHYHQPPRVTVVLRPLLLFLGQRHFRLFSHSLSATIYTIFSFSSLSKLPRLVPTVLPVPSPLLSLPPPTALSPAGCVRVHPRHSLPSFYTLPTTTRRPVQLFHFAPLSFQSLAHPLLFHPMPTSPPSAQQIHRLSILPAHTFHSFPPLSKPKNFQLSKQLGDVSEVAALAPSAMVRMSSFSSFVSAGRRPLPASHPLAPLKNAAVLSFLGQRVLEPAGVRPGNPPRANRASSGRHHVLLSLLSVCLFVCKMFQQPRRSCLFFFASHLASREVPRPSTVKFVTQPWVAA